MPVEYCEYWPAADKCKEWALKNAPDALGKLTVSEDSGAGDAGGGSGGVGSGGGGTSSGVMVSRDSGTVEAIPASRFMSQVTLCSPCLSSTISRRFTERIAHN